MESLSAANALSSSRQAAPCSLTFSRRSAITATSAGSTGLSGRRLCKATHCLAIFTACWAFPFSDLTDRPTSLRFPRLGSLRSVFLTRLLNDLPLVNSEIWFWYLLGNGFGLALVSSSVMGASNRATSPSLCTHLSHTFWAGTAGILNRSERVSHSRASLTSARRSVCQFSMLLARRSIIGSSGVFSRQ